MIVREAKLLNGSKVQYQALDEAIRTAQFIRNKAVRLWRDEQNVNKARLSLLCKELAREFGFASKLNSMARQASSERAWNSISNRGRRSSQAPDFTSGVPMTSIAVVVKVLRKRVIPSLKNILAVVEYKTSGWKLSAIL